MVAQGNMFQRGELRISIYHAFGELAAGGFENQLRGPLAGPVANADVCAAFEAVAGFAAQAERFTRATDVRRIEICALDEHVFGVVVNLRVLAAHDAGERNAFLLVGDQEHVAVQRAFDVVERFEFFALSGAADDDGGLFRLVTSAATGNEVIIESVQRLADFHHHEIGDVHDVVDAADADFFQRGAQPIGAGADLHAFDDARGVARAEFGVIDADGNEVLHFFARTLVADAGNFERVARERGDFPGDADDTVPIRTVRRDFKIVNDIAA